MHRGETYLVESLDLDQRVAVMSPASVDFSTTAREIVDIRVAQVRESQDWAGATLTLGDVEVTHQVVSYLKRRSPGGEVHR